MGDFGYGIHDGIILWRFIKFGSREIRNSKNICRDCNITLYFNVYIRII